MNTTSPTQSAAPLKLRWPDSRRRTMTKRISEYAERETPPAVNIPEGYRGIILWALGRWGAGFMMAGCAVWGLSIVYADMRSDQLTHLRATEKALQSIAGTLESIERRLHQIETTPGRTDPPQ